ncbi:MAG: protein kinase [Planctomyces sp.]|nr:protein kinase [Planctomyces sp.]
MNSGNDTEIQNDDDRERSRRLSLQGSRPPAELEGYSFVRRLGAGAYGTVWLAREERTGRMVAVKFYPHRRGLNWSMLSREVEKLAAVYTSRNIVRLLDVGWNAEPPYFVMEYVENGSLSDYLSKGPLSVEEAVRIIREICSALIDAHGAGVLHCDLKPDNVLLDGQLHARICDFGQSRMSHEQSPALGTLFYMAPEQANLDALPDARWDVYAVGALFFHMLTGQPPWKNPQTQQQLEQAQGLTERLQTYRRLMEQHGPPQTHRSIRGVDARLAEIIEQCLAVRPADRLPNAQAVRDALDARDRQRSRRPLLILGVLGPILLMAATVPIFVNALRDNLKITEQRLEARALESDSLSARLQAASLKDELLDRLEGLEAVMAEKEVSESLRILLKRPSDDIVQEMDALHGRPFAERPRWMQLLDAARERADQTNIARGRSLDTSWFLTDAIGTQLWRREYNGETLGRNFRFRDYFHGQNKEYQPHEVSESITPLTERHVSLAFRSDATGKYMVAFSVPVKDESGNVIGVFCRTAHVGELQAIVGQRLQEETDDSVRRVIALIDSRDWQVLDHPYLTTSVERDLPAADEFFAQLHVDQATIEQIRKSGAGKTGKANKEVLLPTYKDPVGMLPDAAAAPFRESWMAAMSPVSVADMEAPWMVIVQEERSATLEPIDDMARQASKQAWLAVFAALLLMCIVWLFVWKAFNRPVTTRQ